MVTPSASASSLEQLIEELLVCPVSHQPLTVRDGAIACQASSFRGTMQDGVVVMMDQQQKSFFDDKYHVMQSGHDDRGEWGFCYEEQVRLLERYFQPGLRVVDVGCGPSLPYKKNGAFVIGLEASFESIRANRDVDLKVFASGGQMPLPDRSVDVLVCFYSLHHFVGKTVNENRLLVTGAFREFARVMKPGGALFVFEMVPMKPAAALQRLVWNSVRKLLGRKLDMHFWTADFFDTMHRQFMPEAVLERVYFQSSLATIIRPAFSLPQLKLYRFLYPLAPKLFKFLI